MVGYRDLPMGRHDHNAMSSPKVLKTFEQFVTLEHELAALLREHSPTFVPADRKVQLILDALDGPNSLRETAVAGRPSWGLRIFDSVRVFADAAFARVFQAAVARMCGETAESAPGV